VSLVATAMICLKSHEMRILPLPERKLALEILLEERHFGDLLDQKFVDILLVFDPGGGDFLFLSFGFLRGLLLISLLIGLLLVGLLLVGLLLLGLLVGGGLGGGGDLGGRSPLLLRRLEVFVVELAVDLHAGHIHLRRRGDAIDLVHSAERHPVDLERSIDKEETRAELLEENDTMSSIRT